MSSSQLLLPPFFLHRCSLDLAWFDSTEAFPVCGIVHVSQSILTGLAVPSKNSPHVELVCGVRGQPVLCYHPTRPLCRSPYHVCTQRTLSSVVGIPAAIDRCSLASTLAVYALASIRSPFSIGTQPEQIVLHCTTYCASLRTQQFIQRHFRFYHSILTPVNYRSRWYHQYSTVEMKVSKSSLHLERPRH